VLSTPLTNPARTPHTPRTPLAKSKSPKLSQVNLKSKLRKKLLVLKSFGLKKSVLLPVAIVLVASLKFLGYFLEVRIHTVKNHRLGHFATNTELSRLNSEKKRREYRRIQINVYCCQSEEHCNFFLGKMWKRELFLIPAPFGQIVYDISKRALPKSILKSINMDTSGLLIEFSSSLTFLNSELQEGSEFLNSLKQTTGKGHICLNVRDDAFLSRTKPIGWKKTRDWSYQNYRDSDIKTYVAAAETLAEMGYTVFRMGAIVNEPLVSKHSCVVDYATNGMRTEFLDVFLGAHCSFCIGTGSGWDSIPIIFRQPTLLVNHLPIFELSVLTLPLVIHPKILLDEKFGEVLSLNDLLRRNVLNCLNTSGYADAGVEIRDLSSEELVEAVTEMAQRVEGTFVETPEQREMQAKLKHILSTHPKLQPSPNYYPIRAQFASCFLSRYPNFLDGLD
jgi:putative glycosyltransferase (TIGR04372 family)